MTIRMGAREARNNFSDLIGRVHYGGDTVIIERNGKPMVAMVSMDFYERNQAFAVIDQFRRDLPDIPPEEVERDVAEAIAAVRAAKRAELT